MGDDFAPSMSEEELRELMKKEMDESKITFGLYTKPIFKGKKGTIRFGNPKNSAHDIELTVKVDNKTVIKTVKVPPNKYISKVKLMGKGLEKGVHKGDGIVSAYNRKTGELVGEIAVDMTITVE